MWMSGRTAVVVVAVALSAACSGSQPAAQPGAAASAPPAAAAVPAGDFGVPECDEYFAKYLACINDKVPEAAGPRSGSRWTRRGSMERAAATPEGKSALASGCPQATAAAKQAMSA